MGHRQRARQLEDALDAAVLALRRRDTLGAYEALRPFASEDVLTRNPPDADAAQGPASKVTTATSGVTAAPAPAAPPADRTEDRRRRRRDR
jgi:hypothetical protein